MTVFCIMKDYNGNKSLEFVFEKSSRACATKERLENKIAEEDKGLVTYRIKEMHVFAGEETKNVSTNQENRDR